MKDWDALYEECIHCQKCGLAETRTNVVFGEGARDAEVMFIGEGPGEQEDRTGRPPDSRNGSTAGPGIGGGFRNFAVRSGWRQAAGRSRASGFPGWRNAGFRRLCCSAVFPAANLRLPFER